MKLSTYHKDAILRAIVQDLPPVGNLSEQLTAAAVSNVVADLVKLGLVLKVERA